MDFADIPSDCPPGTNTTTGIFHFSKTSDPSDHLHFWVTSNHPDLLKQATDHFASRGYDSHYYVSYASRDHYIAHHNHRAPLHPNVIELVPPSASAATHNPQPPPRSSPSSSKAASSTAASPAALISPMRKKPPPPPPPPPPPATTPRCNTATQPMATSPITTTFTTPFTSTFDSTPLPQGGLPPFHLYGQQNQHQQQQQQPSQPDMMALVAQMIQQNALAMQQLAASQQSMAHSTALKGPTASFPKWDPSTTPNNIAVYLELIRAYKADPFFSPVTDWATTFPHSQLHSSRIHRDMLTNLPSSHTSSYLNNPTFVSPTGGHLGIEMLAHFIDTLQPSRPETRLTHLQAISHLQLGAQESLSEFWAKVRLHANALGTLSFYDAAPLLGLAALAASDKCQGLLNRYYSGDPIVTAANLLTMEELSKNEELRRNTLGGSDHSPPIAANRTTNATPSTHPTAPDQSASQQPAFPPSKGVRWRTLKAVHDDKTCCPYCFSRDEFHWKIGCPFLASLGIVTASDSSKAADITTKFAEHTGRNSGGDNANHSTSRRNNRNNRRNNRSANNTTTSPTDASNTTPPTPGADAASGCRATSSERPPTMSQRPPASNRTMYPDGFGSSSDEEDFGTGIDEHFQGSSSSGNPNKSNSALYPLPSYTNNLTSAMLPTSNRTTTSLSTQLSTVAATVLKHSPSCVFAPDHTDPTHDCCADSGATHMMLPDIMAFKTYRPQYNRTVKLGDNSKLPIAGEGTAVFSLNGKVITVRNALHVPDLRQPLYSLRKHKTMPGCGTFSHNDTGSFILFPSFVLRIDDSIDNIVTYKSIGRQQPNIQSDYIEPRHTSLNATFTQTPHVIPSDDASLTNNIPSTPAAIIPDDELIASASEPSTSLLQSLHDDITKLPPIRPQNTPAPCESRTTFDPLKLHKIYGCRKFKNQRHIIAASQNAKLISTGEFPVSLGSFTTINNPPAGKTRKKRRKFLDTVHMDIVFGDCVSLGGYTHALLLVDAGTRYSWIYGLASLTSANIIDALQQFYAHVGRLPNVFHTDFDTKLIGGATQRWILSNKSNIIATPANRHSANGLVERTWQTIVTMARAYITEKQVSRNFWFYAIAHAANMLNQVPGRLGRKLTSPFELVHGVKPDSKTWFELFSVGYFSHQNDGSSKRSKCDAHTLDGIAVGRDDKSNTIVFYNPITKRYYRPPAFKLDESRLPATSFPKSIRYDGGLTCGMLRNRSDPIPEPFPPGMRVNVLLPHSESPPLKGTVQNIPLPSDDNTTDKPTPYTIHLDDGTTIEAQFHQLCNPSSSVSLPHDSHSYTNARISGLPHDLQPNSKVTFDHNGAFHKGYLVYNNDHGFSFEYRRHARATKPEWTVPLPNFLLNWPTLLADDLLFPGHSTISSFLRPSSSLTPTPTTSTSANFVSATGLQLPCPSSLKFALDSSNPDRFIWSQSYYEEKGGLENMDVFRRISKQEYARLRKSNKVPQAIPSMCVIVIKYDKYGNPHRAKCRIVALGNFEDRYYSKSKRYAPVLKYSSLRLLTSMAVADREILQQGDCKQAFCNATLPEEECTVVRPPIGDPAHSKGEYWLLNKTLYGLRRSPRHWYDMMSNILIKMGLSASVHDPCLYSGHVTSTSDTSFTHPLHIGLYVDDFVFYTKDKAHEAAFRAELAKHIAVDWMGDVDFFLGTSFLWKRLDDGNVSVHLSQATFTEHLAQRFSVDTMNKMPNMTPYRSGLPIDSIPASDPNDPDLPRRRKVYQSIVGSINWLATNTRPDVAPALTFLASYMQLPSHQHYKAAINVLKYLYSTSDYGLSYHSDSSNTLQAYNHFPNHHDKEAYNDATPPSPSECTQLTAYSDACWGGQIGNSVPDGTPIELFKLRSLSGFILCRCGGPIAWKSIRQPQTALSSCEAEVIATNECVTELLGIRNRCADMLLPDTTTPTIVYNDNQACVDWSSTVTTKGIKHVNLRENRVREAQVAGHIQVKHIPGIINSADIFTKELKDSAHFRRLRDSFMVSKSKFQRFHHNVPSHMAP